MLTKSVSSKPRLLRDAPLPAWRGNLFFLLCLLLAKEAENTTHQGLKNLLNLALKLRWWPRTGSTLAAPRARASPGACSQLPAAHPWQAQIWGLCFWSSQGQGTAKGRNLNCALLLQVYIIHCFRKRSEYWVLGGDLAQCSCRNVFVVVVVLLFVCFCFSSQQLKGAALCFLCLPWILWLCISGMAWNLLPKSRCLSFYHWVVPSGVVTCPLCSDFWDAICVFAGQLTYCGQPASEEMG